MIRHIIAAAMSLALAAGAAAPATAATQCKDANGKFVKCPPKSTPKATPAVAPAARNYDCSKPGNANKTACKGAAAPKVTPPKPKLAAAPAASPSKGAGTNMAGPQGASAKCRDNTYSHSKTRTGTCAGHGGVAQWY